MIPTKVFTRFRIYKIFINILFGNYNVWTNLSDAFLSETWSCLILFVDTIPFIALCKNLHGHIILRRVWTTDAEISISDVLGSHYRPFLRWTKDFLKWNFQLLQLDSKVLTCLNTNIREIWIWNSILIFVSKAKMFFHYVIFRLSMSDKNDSHFVIFWAIYTFLKHMYKSSLVGIKILPGLTNSIF